MSKQKHLSLTETPRHAVAALQAQGIEQIQEMLKTVDAAVEALSDVSEDNLRKVRKQLRKSARRTRGMLGGLEVNARGLRTAMDHSGRYLRRHPWGVGLALAAVGLAAAVLASSHGTARPS